MWDWSRALAWRRRATTSLASIATKRKIARLRQGELPIYEPGLDEWLARHLASGRLAFSTDKAASAGEADAAFIGVGTPQGEDGSADLTDVWRWPWATGARASGRPPLVVVEEHGAGGHRRPGTHAPPSRPVHRPGPPSGLQPRVPEGRGAIDDFVKPDRVVVGRSDSAVRKVMKGLYQPYLRTASRCCACSRPAPK